LIRGTIDNRRGELILRALNTAVRNARRVNFKNGGDMITKLPDFPNLNPKANPEVIAEETMQTK